MSNVQLGKDNLLEYNRLSKYLMSWTRKESNWPSVTQKVFIVQEYICIYCGKDVYDTPFCDHIVERMELPLTKKAWYDTSNLGCCCRTCHNTKTSMMKVAREQYNASSIVKHIGSSAPINIYDKESIIAAVRKKVRKQKFRW